MFTTIPLAQITPSPTNPRKHFDDEALKELSDSIKDLGVLQPIVVRPMETAESFEIVAGERRFRAAGLAGLDEIPAVVKDLNDLEVLEVQIIENLHRADLHPLEEAESYRVLHDQHGHSVDDIAARLGKSKSYVYDRMKLCGLIEVARTAFLEDRITPGHAIVLARLKPIDQETIFAPGSRALFQHEDVLFDHVEGKPGSQEKARSVAELQSWIDKHVRFEVAETDPLLFPETAAALESAEEEGEKVLAVTYDHALAPMARDSKIRTLTAKSWKRADGEHGSTVCDQARPAIVAAGVRRGEALRVCTDKKGCKVHWAKEQREAAKRAKEAANDPDAGKSRHKIEQERREAQAKKEQEEKIRFNKAIPAIADALVARMNVAATGGSSFLAKLILDELKPWRPDQVKLADKMPAGETDESLIRKAAFLILIRKMDAWDAARTFPKIAKSLDVDVKAILNEVAPVKREKKAPATKKVKGKSPKRVKPGKAMA